jgi:hypothetical protein
MKAHARSSPAGRQAVTQLDSRPACSRRRHAPDGTSPSKPLTGRRPAVHGGPPAAEVQPGWGQIRACLQVPLGHAGPLTQYHRQCTCAHPALDRQGSDISG